MARRDTAQLTETFELLTDPRRRYVLYYLTKESESADIETLADAISEYEDRQIGTEQSRDYTTGLYHTHLPKLADAGVIAFDERTGKVELRGADRLDGFLDGAARIDDCVQAAVDD